MKTLITSFLSMFLIVGLMATNNPTLPKSGLQKSKAEIEQSMQSLDLLDSYITDEKVSFADLKANHGTVVSETNLKSSSEEDNLFKATDDAPLGIPGILWGLVLGLLGVLIVYLVMDDGSDRKQEVRGAFIGCLIGVLLFGGYWFLVDNASPDHHNLDKVEQVSVKMA
jgi:hypothetical protein